MLLQFTLQYVIVDQRDREEEKEAAMKLEKELQHPGQPQHRLKAAYAEAPFLCDCCSEAGIGLEYTCDACKFDLHRACALAPPAAAHPFYRCCCDACRREVLSLVYHCARCGFDLHPCCAALPQRLDGSRSGHRFNLFQKLPAGACHRCGGRGRGWCYRSECGSYNLHVACMKEVLVESWEAVFLRRKGKISGVETAAVVPSLRGTMQSYHRPGKARRCCEMAVDALRIIISAVLGDPTASIAAVVRARAFK